jgi:hypothetical protein
MLSRQLLPLLILAASLSAQTNGSGPSMYFAKIPASKIAKSLGLPPASDELQVFVSKLRDDTAMVKVTVTTSISGNRDAGQTIASRTSEVTNGFARVTFLIPDASTVVVQSPVTVVEFSQSRSTDFPGDAPAIMNSPRQQSGPSNTSCR